MLNIMNKSGIHGKFKLLRDHLLDRVLFEGHEVFIISEITKDGIPINSHRDYRIGSKIYKDYNEKCPKGRYKIKVIEY